MKKELLINLINEKRTRIDVRIDNIDNNSISEIDTILVNADYEVYNENMTYRTYLLKSIF
jgi:hypothetical protein